MLKDGNGSETRERSDWRILESERRRPVGVVGLIFPLCLQSLMWNTWAATEEDKPARCLKQISALEGLLVPWLCADR